MKTLYLVTYRSPEEKPMQDFTDIAKKNGVTLSETGACQFCGAVTTRGVFECLEISSLGFSNIDYSQKENHFYRFLIVDAHALHHPEIHGRWNNHFHLTRLHLIFNYKIKWNYKLSPLLSDYLNDYKKGKPEERLNPPPALQRGKITASQILNNAKNVTECQNMIINWGKEVYNIWQQHHGTVDWIASEFLKRNSTII